MHGQPPKLPWWIGLQIIFKNEINKAEEIPAKL
jgi:hypothetical protein